MNYATFVAEYLPQKKVFQFMPKYTILVQTRNIIVQPARSVLCLLMTGIPIFILHPTIQNERERVQMIVLLLLIRYVVVVIVYLVLVVVISGELL